MRLLTVGLLVVATSCGADQATMKGTSGAAGATGSTASSGASNDPEKTDEEKDPEVVAGKAGKNSKTGTTDTTETAGTAGSPETEGTTDITTTTAANGNTGTSGATGTTGATVATGSIGTTRTGDTPGPDPAEDLLVGFWATLPECGGTGLTSFCSWTVIKFGADGTYALFHKSGGANQGGSESQPPAALPADGNYPHGKYTLAKAAAEGEMIEIDYEATATEFRAYTDQEGAAAAGCGPAVVRAGNGIFVDGTPPAACSGLHAGQGWPNEAGAKVTGFVKISAPADLNKNGDLRRPIDMNFNTSEPTLGGFVTKTNRWFQVTD